MSTGRGRAPLAGTTGGWPPVSWLEATGRAHAVLTAWKHGRSGEVPAGAGFDAVRIPVPLVAGTVWRTALSGVPLGPVISSPLGAEFLLRPGTADGWTTGGGAVLRRGTLVLLPAPHVTDLSPVAARGWRVGPSLPLWAGEVLEAACREACAATAAAAAEEAAAVTAAALP
ncbi:hypothetical protein [Streptomyces sp. SS8]